MAETRASTTRKTSPGNFLERDGEKISTLDLFGRNFVLLAGPEGDAWRESGYEVTEQSEIELDIYQVGGADGLIDPEGGFPETYGIAPTGAVLVRPDGFVGWRAMTAADASAQTITRALASLLCTDVADRHIQSDQSVGVDGDTDPVRLLDGAHEAEQPSPEPVPKARSLPRAKTIALFALAAGVVITAAAWWRNRRQDWTA